MNPCARVQIVQHLCAGGIEVMAIEAMRCDSELITVALEGVAEDAIERWPLLAPFADRLIFLNKRTGIDPFAFGRLIRHLHRLRPRAVLSHHIGPLLYGGLAARLVGVRCFGYLEHDVWHLDDPRQRRLQSIAMRLLRPVPLAVAEYVATCMNKALPTGAVTVCYAPLDCDRFAPGVKSCALPADKRIVGTAARLEPVKGVDRIIRTLAFLPEDVHLIVAGDGSARADLERLAQDEEVAGRVTFLGRVDDMPAFYRACDLFVLASRAEGLPLTLIEAQACGVPAVATDAGGSIEALAGGTCAIVQGEPAKALARMIEARLNIHEQPDPRAFACDRFDGRSNLRRLWARIEDIGR
ncbi:MAG: glycosyltransferase [Pseudomonadota bacterium]|nr:glycosyltransferase [Pseudomonadota bacterium]